MTPEDAKECIHISVILQLLYEGEANITQLAPAVQSYIKGLISEFEENPDDPNNQLLYYAANTMLEFDKEKLH